MGYDTERKKRRETFKDVHGIVYELDAVTGGGIGTLVIIARCGVRSPPHSHDTLMAADEWWESQVTCLCCIGWGGH